MVHYWEMKSSYYFFSFALFILFSTLILKHISLIYSYSPVMGALNGSLHDEPGSLLLLRGLFLKLNNWTTWYWLSLMSFCDQQSEQTVGISGTQMESSLYGPHSSGRSAHATNDNKWYFKHMFFTVLMNYKHLAPRSSQYLLIGISERHMGLSCTNNWT